MKDVFMKKISGFALTTILLLLISTPALFSVDKADFDNIIDFSVTIKTLNQMAVGEGSPASSIDLNKLFLLNGTASSITIINSKENEFQVLVDLVSGEWLGLEDVKSYHSLILFEGPEFYRIFPKRKPKQPVPGLITPNDRIMVVARAIRLVTTETGKKSWLLKGFYVRSIR